MATLVLTTVGRAVGGPLGALAGALAGSALDRALLGDTGRRPAPADLAIQGANYGDPLQRLYGTIRAGGQIIWSTGIQARGSGSKAGSSRGFAASFAVALSARPIAGVARIWADSRLIRNSSGQLAVPGTLRVHRGEPGQIPDPLIAAAEGPLGAPAYRGLAYVVFEELALEEFGNRIPQLSFEVVADSTAATVDLIARDLFAAAGAVTPATAGLDRGPTGFGAARSSRLADWLEQLALLAPMALAVDGPRMSLRAHGMAPSATIDPGECIAGTGANRDAEAHAYVRETAARPVATSLVYLDVARDQQPGLQRAALAAGEREARAAIPAAMAAGQARAVVERLAREHRTQREMRTIRAPLRLATLEPGDVVAMAGENRHWRVRRAMLSGLAVELELEAMTAAAGAATMAADPGRPDLSPFAVQGPTRWVAMDLPALPWEPSEVPRLLVAAAGADEHWRRAELMVSADNGASWMSAGLATRPATLGVSADKLGDGPAELWDEHGAVEVILDRPAAWLEPCTAAAALGGANLCLLGSELLHFREAQPLAPGRFRLRGLLRGRFGTESATASHDAGERFVLLDPRDLVRVELGPHLLGSPLLIRALGPLDSPGLVDAQQVTLGGRALLPYRPARLTATRLPDGSVRLGWVARGRAYAGWQDGAPPPPPAPFQLRLTAGTAVRSFICPAEELLLSASEQTALFGGPLTDFATELVPTHPAAGFGEALHASFSLPPA